MKFSEEMVRSFFADDGNIARIYPGYEKRPQQQVMAAEIWKGITDSRHCIAEAGTGVGKSYAYAVPAIAFSHSFNKKVVISTRTINLQDQLVRRDLPFLERAFDFPFTFHVLMGRGNYICLRRFRFVDKHITDILLTEQEHNEFRRLKEVISTLINGTKDELPFIPHPGVWKNICCESSACPGGTCDFYQNCFYQYSRSVIRKTDIIVVNHSLYFADMVLRTDNSVRNILPEHSYVVFDEAHTLEEAARSHLGETLTNFQLIYLLREIYNPQNRKGLLAMFDAGEARNICKVALHESTLFFERIEKEARRRTEKMFSREEDKLWELTDNDAIDDTISHICNDLAGSLRGIIDGMQDDKPQDEKMCDILDELEQKHKRLMDISETIRTFSVPNHDPNCVSWVEYGQGKSGQILSLNRVPIDIAPYMNRLLFEELESVIMTGATLSTRSSATDFSYFSKTIGVSDYRAVKLDSPFDYKNNMHVYIARSIPSPQEQNFLQKAEEKAGAMIQEFSGGTLILFTSYRMMNRCFQDMSPGLLQQGKTILLQGKEKNRSMLLGEFKKAQNAVLFATSSFWMGVDVPGEALSNVFLMKLPFSVPTHPVIKGKCNLIKKRGGNPFIEYMLPEAVLTFKQGVGRLLRSKKDTGNIVIFDSRVANKRYGRYFRDAIPECTVEFF